MEKGHGAERTFLSGVFALALSTALCKVVGFAYKIPMLSCLGAEGMGYFHSAYEIYALFCVISTAGLPVALSVLVSSALAEGDTRGAERIYRTSLGVFLGVGLLGSGAMAALSPLFCRLIRSENARGCILAISPTVLLVCISSAIRGYFQGFQRMTQTAVSQLTEAVGKLVFGLLLAGLAVRRGWGTPAVAAMAGAGLTAGTLLSTLYLVAEKIRFRPALHGPCFLPREKGTLMQLTKLALPMTLGASAVSLTRLIDMAMILRRLQSVGYSAAAANAAYGSYTTLALSVYALVPTLLSSVALPLVPLLSAAITSGDLDRQAALIRASYRLTAVIALPASLGLSMFARPILLLLFGREPDAVETAAPLLALLGASVFLSCMIGAVNSVLHAYRAVTRPILSLLAGAAVKTLAAYFLIGSPAVGLRGAPISTFLCNAVIVGLNLAFSARLCRVGGLGGVFAKPLAASALAVGLCGISYRLLADALGGSRRLTLGVLTACVLLYPVFGCITGGIREEDLAMLPGGTGICRVLTACRLLPRGSGKETKHDGTGKKAVGEKPV